MSQAHLKKKASLIRQLIEEINQQHPDVTAPLLAEFARQFYSMVSLEDLQDNDTNDLYGIVQSLWQFNYQRQAKETKIRVYNPQFEQNHWQSNHTIIEICSDDMPFLVDSTCMEINRQGYSIHFIIHVGGMHFTRNMANEITEVLPLVTLHDGKHYDSVMHIQIDRQTDEEKLAALSEGIKKIRQDVALSVRDWQHMRERVDECLNDLIEHPHNLNNEDVQEAKDFMRWLNKDNFIYLGVRDYELVGKGDEQSLQIIPDTSLGVLSDTSHSVQQRKIATMPEAAKRQLLSQNILMIAKTNTISSVHRPAYTDFIGVKRFDESGKMIGERRFIGLYTSTAYNTSIKHIPYLRRKVARIMHKSGLLPTGHAAKALLNILENLPRDDLFQSNIDELFDLSLGIYHLLERRRVRLFVREDVYGRFFSCLVFVPRYRFNTELRQALQTILMRAFKGTSISYTTLFTESMLARIHFEVRVNPKQKIKYDVKEIERELIAVSRTWQDGLTDAVHERFGEEIAVQYLRRYGPAFPASYRESYAAMNAVYDIENMERLDDSHPIVINFYRSDLDKVGEYRLKLFQRHRGFILSDTLPVLENLGLRLLSESLYHINGKETDTIDAWISDFRVCAKAPITIDLPKVKTLFQEAFIAVWSGRAENDAFNHLVIAAQLSWREVSLIRAFAKYLRQIGLTFTQSYVASVMLEHADLTRLLVDLFTLAFSEAMNTERQARYDDLLAQLDKGLEAVLNIDADRIIRRCLEIIKATVRTNYFQVDKNGQPKSYTSFKLKPACITDMPQPVPFYEIYVYSPDFEGVHLRMSSVARGGLRWSDRPEDFRTEVLGLMKAQQVKNSVIVPQGAKGGFVVKRKPAEDTPDGIIKNAIACYQNFIRGMLDIADNLIDGKVVKPANTVIYDDDDHYLVVAADKGTATFSDIANAIAEEYQFWLGDAFASGGKTGYDHKKMGITARGAWESVKQNFRDIDIDQSQQDFTVVGIGDMSGDVFGNGMLLSEHIQLMAAFNHLHIFIDPNPDAAASFTERQRLFNLPRSSWEDYNHELISKGGGVFSRRAKSISVSPEMKARFDIAADKIEPNDLIRHILMAKVDLLWNGGIGTYVKAETEFDSLVGDPSNDHIRINGNQLRARVVAEGGNLGLTQLGRVEYALQGGYIFTDFIDNSAGVDCSDHEVNIKILLNKIVAAGDLTEKQRNNLLTTMSDDVAELVLFDNQMQTKAISRATYQSQQSIELFLRYINKLEQAGDLDRHLTFIPDKKTLQKRQAIFKGLTQPEQAILLAYTKITVKRDILASDIPEQACLFSLLQRGFPKPLHQRFQNAISQHPLRREIIATQLTNHLVDEMGTIYVNQLRDETGMDIPVIVRAYIIVNDIFEMPKLRSALAALDSKHDKAYKTTIENHYTLMINRVLRRAARWLIRRYSGNLNIETNITEFSGQVNQLRKMLPDVLRGVGKKKYRRHLKELLALGIDNKVAEQIASSLVLFSALDIITGSNSEGCSLHDFADLYYRVGERLQIDWLREEVSGLEFSNFWEALARGSYRDDIDMLQRQITINIFNFSTKTNTSEPHIARWLKTNERPVHRWLNIIERLQNSTIDYTKIYIAIRELTELSKVYDETGVNDLLLSEE